MKKLINLLLFTFSVVFLFSQSMNVKRYNLTTFTADVKSNLTIAKQLNSAASQQHPEFGILPFNAPCSNCVEVLDKRTLYSRLFADAADVNHVYAQQSYLPIHYTTAGSDVLHTIDYRLKPDPKIKNLFTATHQPVAATCDLNNHFTSLTEDNNEFKFNAHLRLYYADKNGTFTLGSPANYEHYTIGEEGQHVTNIWDGIDMQQTFETGEIKTSYIISAPLNLPSNEGWLVVEDHLSLPAGFTIEPADRESALPGGFYAGDMVVKDANHLTQFTYGKPVCYDANVTGISALYKLVTDGNNYLLRLFVPVEWLSRPGNTYPLTIDPIVSGTTKMGEYRLTGQTAALGFTSQALGTCDYHMYVIVPGKSKLKNAYIGLEFQLTYDNNCGNPALPPPFCTYTQATMEVLCDSCGTTTGILGCSPLIPPFTGTCTTDSNLVPGARPVNTNYLDTNFLSCYPVQIPDYNIRFTLKNRDSICGDVCGYLCARGNMWQMMVEAELIDSLVQTGIGELGNTTVTLVPNPATGSVTISTDESLIGGIVTVSDTRGRKLLAVKLETENQKLETENFATGVYFVTVAKQGRSVTRKLLKQ